MSIGIFKINYGTDLTFDFAWPDGAGGVVDLTDWTVNLLDVTETLTGFVTATKSDSPETGVIVVRVEWSSELYKDKNYNFRVQISKDGEDQSTNMLRVIYV